MRTSLIYSSRRYGVDFCDVIVSPGRRAEDPASQALRGAGRARRCACRRARRPPRGHAADQLSRRAAGQPAQGRDRRGHPRPPGGDHRGGDRLGQDDPDTQDLPGARPRQRRPDRPHPAAAAGRPDGRRTDRRGARQPAGRGGRLPGPVHRRVRRRHAGEADDRRHPAERARPRPGPAPLRHADHRRGARAQPEHRLHPRLPQAAAAPPPGPEGDHHVRDHRPRAVRGRLRRRADRRGVRPDLPGGGPVPAGGRGR